MGVCFITGVLSNTVTCHSCAPLVSQLVMDEVTQAAQHVLTLAANIALVLSRSRSFVSEVSSCSVFGFWGLKIGLGSGGTDAPSSAGSSGRAWAFLPFTFFVFVVVLFFSSYS